MMPYAERRQPPGTTRPQGDHQLEGPRLQSTLPDETPGSTVSVARGHGATGRDKPPLSANLSWYESNSGELLIIGPLDDV